MPRGKDTRARQPTALMTVEFESYESRGDFQTLGPGTYSGHSRGYKRSDVPCPYCRALMQQAIPVGDDPCRIVRVLRDLPPYDDGRRRAHVVGHRIPATHRVLACRPCKAVFTFPKRSNRVGSASGQPD